MPSKRSSWKVELSNCCLLMNQIGADVGDVVESIGVLSGDLDRLPGDCVGVPAVGEIRRVLEPVVEPGSALDPVISGELVPCEQVRLVEDEALGVLIRL